MSYTIKYKILVYSNNKSSLKITRKKRLKKFNISFIYPFPIFHISSFLFIKRRLYPIDMKM